MKEHVRQCPICGYLNPESEGKSCAGCNEFLGLVVPKERNSASESCLDQPAFDAGLKADSSADLPPEKQAQQDSVTQIYREPGGPKELKLECVGKPGVVSVKNGDVLGQAHPSSSAQIQINDVPGILCVHRRHVQFNFTDSQWFCTPLMNSPDTNPTLRNGKKMEHSISFPVAEGDMLTLSNVSFIVRIG